MKNPSLTISVQGLAVGWQLGDTRSTVIWPSRGPRIPGVSSTTAVNAAGSQIARHFLDRSQQTSRAVACACLGNMPPNPSIRRGPKHSQSRWAIPLEITRAGTQIADAGVMVEIGTRFRTPLCCFAGHAAAILRKTGVIIRR